MPVDLQEQSDVDLVALACADDAEAFAALVERYRLLALSIALRLLKQPEEAQDAVQEAILGAYLGLDRLRDPARFKPWFYGIVLNVCRSRRRPQRPLLLSLDGLTDEMALAGGLDLHEVVEERELRRLVQTALQELVPGQREVLVLFYYDGLSHQEITQRLHLSLAAVKSRLHKGREQLRRQIAAAYPELQSALAPRPRTPRKQGDISMTDLRIAQVQPQDPRVLVVLLDSSDQRALPLWLPGPEGYPLALLDKKRRDAAHHPAPQPEQPTFGTFDFVENVLRATETTVQAVHIEAIEERAYANVVVRGPTGEHKIKARLGEGLFAALRFGTPLVAAEDLVGRLGVSVPADGRPLAERLDAVAQSVSASAPTSRPERERIAEPENLRFADGLERWELRGSFLLDSSGLHWRDYACGTEATGRRPGEMSAYLKAAVASPVGFADLRQAILADAFRGKRVRLSGELKSVEVGQNASLYLRVIDVGRTKRPEERQEIAVQGTQEWRRYETSAEVPTDSVFILFGISLTGPGQVWITDVRLETV